MTDKDIFYKAFKRAEAGGYKNVNFNHPMSREQSDNIIKYYWIRAFIFDHGFAKAFWGNDEVDERGRTLIKAWEEEYRDSGLFMDFDEFAGEPEIYYVEEWFYHLTKMVTAKEPLKYLEKFL